MSDKQKVVDRLTNKRVFIRNFKKTVWGFASVEADSMEEAAKKFDEEDETYDEFDNKSDYEWEDEIKER